MAETRQRLVGEVGTRRQALAAFQSVVQSSHWVTQWVTQWVTPE